MSGAATIILLLLGLSSLIQAADNSTDAEKTLRYQRLYQIPGNDFVGFGYDAKFADPIQAVRLPLSDWTFDSRKTYKYPVYRDYVYRVPDQLFVRTVARTDMNNFVFSSTDELSEKIAVGAGLNYSRSTEGTSSGDMSVGERLALLNALKSNATASSNTSVNATTPKDAGYGDLPYIPGEQVTQGSSMFSVGAEINYLRTSVDTKNKYIVQNEQINQFYQLFLDKRKLRQEFVDDALALAGRKWSSNDQKLFINFFEKYGTHVIVSSMMGGAISMTSVVENTAQVTTDNVNVAINILFNSSSLVGTNVTQEEAFIENSPNCTGNFAGYVFNTLTRQCVLPPTVTCFSPMTELVEKFTQINASEEVNWEIKNGASPQPTRSEQTYTTAYGFCKPNGVAEVKREDPNDPSGAYKGTYSKNANTQVNLELERVTRSDYTGWEVKASAGEDKRFRVTMYPNLQSCSQSCCNERTQRHCGWFGCYTTCYGCRDFPCNEAYSFAGIYPCAYPLRTAKVNPVFYKGPTFAIAGTGWSNDATSGTSLMINSTLQEYENVPNQFKRIGKIIDLKTPARPGYFRFSTKIDSTNLARAWNNAVGTYYERNVLEILDAGDKNNANDDQYILKFKMTKTLLVVQVASTEIPLTSVGSLRANVWYNFIVRFNWSDSTFDLWIDYNNTNTNPTANPKVQRVLANIPFLVKTASRITRINLYNFDTVTSYWDDFTFCNAFDTAKYEPISKTAAVKSTTSTFKQTVNGNVDFGFEQEFGKFTFSQSNNYRLKGGNSAKVDLLDLRKAYNTFEIWKGTIMQNPAPVSFVLKKLSHLMPDEKVNDINRRDELAFAIGEYFKIEKSTSLVVTGNPDVANNTILRAA